MKWRTRNTFGLLVLAVAAIGCTPESLGGPDGDDASIIELEATADVVTGICQMPFTPVQGLVALVDGTEFDELTQDLSTVKENFNRVVVDETNLSATDKTKVRKVAVFSEAGDVPTVPDLPNRIITVTKNAAQGSAGWCGANTNATIQVWLCDPGPGPTDPVPFVDRATTLLHEMLNSLGVPDQNSDATAGCSVNAGSNPITTEPCIYEVQREYETCGLRGNHFVDMDAALVTGVFIAGPASLETGSNQTYTATLIDNDPETNQTATVSWLVTNEVPDNTVLSTPSPTTGATTSISANKAGSGDLTANVSPASQVVYPWPVDEKAITVTDPPPLPPPVVASVVLTPGSMKLTDLNANTLYSRFELEVLDASGQPISGIPVTVTSSNPAVAFVQLLRIEGRSTGLVIVTATAGGISDNAFVSVQCGLPNGTPCLQF